ncbi:hypothetical protein [Zunongwangia profunda]|uniref:hypothetical protein n=1 Tax=Zunongwangia profunda TaxID=398743 RepID=UPI0030D874FE|tara:strand:+ start:798 stop:1166 length:369 start_codon:yes stop_codon:yes gene_type:complete
MKYLLIIFICLISHGNIAQECDVAITETHKFVGKEVVVCGEVTQVASPRGIQGNPTYLNMGGRYPNQTFTVVIWGQEAMQFPMGFLKSLEGERIAVSGVIVDYRGKPQIVVGDVGEVVLKED